MAIKEKKNADGETVYVYDIVKREAIIEQANVVAELLKKFILVTTDLKFPDDIELDEVLVQETVVRIDKRRDYFSIFHEETKINEAKEAALWAYWIVKFKPIQIKSAVLSTYNPDQKAALKHINEKFAAYLIFTAVKAESESRNYEFHIQEDYEVRLLYALKYWHLNKSAFMMIVDSLCAGMH